MNVNVFNAAAALLALQVLEGGTIDADEIVQAAKNIDAAPEALAEAMVARIEDDNWEKDSLAKDEESRTQWKNKFLQ